jgi:hypothetical protein
MERRVEFGVGVLEESVLFALIVKGAITSFCSIE